MHVQIRTAEVADFDEADRVIQAAFQRPISFLPMLELHREIQPDGMWLATRDGQIVGTVSCVDYGQVSYVGLMTVRPDCEGQGIARSLMAKVLEWLRLRGCPCALLDATELGAPLYEKLGFVDDAFAYAYLKSSALAVAPGNFARQPAIELREACQDDLPAIVALDAIAFGADRQKLFSALWRLPAARWLVALDKEGDLVGYLCARDPIVGPWCAVDSKVATALLCEGLQLPFSSPPLVHVPRSNDACRELLSAGGFVEQRRLRHMRYGGAAPPGCPAMLFGQSSFGHG